MYTYELYSINGGVGFKILCDSNPIIVQDYKPDVDGFVVMSEEEALTAVKTVLARMV